MEAIPVVVATPEAVGPSAPQYGYEDDAHRHSYNPQYQGQHSSYAQAPAQQQMNHGYAHAAAPQHQQQQYAPQYQQQPPIGQQPYYNMQSQPQQQHYAQPPQQHYAQQPVAYAQPPQLSSSTRVLADAERLIVKQKFEAVEALANAAANAVGMEALGNLGEVANTYRVYNHDGMDKFRVVEESEYCGPTGRCCCNPNHELTLHVFAPEVSPTKSVMRYERPCKCGQCCAVCNVCQQEMVAYDGEGGQVGYIRQPFLGGGFSPKLEVMDRDGDAPYATVESDATCCIAGMCCDHTFVVKDPAGNEIGKVVKQKPSGFQEVAVQLASDSDVFAIEFRRDLDVDKKATMFGALYLIDYMFFENEGEARADLVNKRGSYKCCDLYCCGCSVPCRINCGDYER